MLLVPVRPSDDLFPLAAVRSRPCQRSIDVVILLDLNSAVDELSFVASLAFLNDVIRALWSPEGAAHVVTSDSAPRVGLVTSDGAPRVRFRLSDHADDAFATTNRVWAVGHSAGLNDMAGSLRVIRETMFAEASGARSDASHVVLVLSTGISDGDWKAAREEATAARGVGIDVVVVGIRTEVGDELRHLVEDESKLIMLPEFRSLGEAVLVTAETLCGSR